MPRQKARGGFNMRCKVVELESEPHFEGTTNSCQSALIVTVLHSDTLRRAVQACS